MRLDLTIVLVVLVAFAAAQPPYPIVMFHGINDACDAGWMVDVLAQLSSSLLVYARCIEIGDGRRSSWLMDIESQGAEACEKLNADPNFAGNFSVVAFSQGGMIGRYILQRCKKKGVVRRFLSIGGPNMGVAAIPECVNSFFCPLANSLLADVVYFRFVQKLLGPAGYFKDPLHYERFLRDSLYAADLNNERGEKDKGYVQAFDGLERLLLVMFDADTMIIPKESPWFIFYDDKMNLVPLEESKFFKEDFLGIRRLNESGRVTFLELPGPHLSFTYSDVQEHFIPALRG